ncbi:MAG: glycosyl transferase family 1 [Aquifex sp.]|nr:MAG: glycosyl transferase family 1 [Aquifex sp.]
MKVILDKGVPIDVLFIAEGTYPYVRGGVSTWIHQLITGMPNVKFGVLFLGSREEDYEGIRYNLPENLVYLETYYLFSKVEYPEPQEIEGSDEVEVLKTLFLEGVNPAEELLSLSFYTEKVTLKDFLYGKKTFSFIQDLYEELGVEVPFIDFFWTVKNILTPLWIVVKAIESVKLREIGLIHSPSTGYAGFLGAMLNKEKGIPLVISEHGLYTKERKIDILNAPWIKQARRVIGPKYEIDELKKFWIQFFINIGKFSYLRANMVYSLFEEARKAQIELGCPPEKTGVIPNGVEISKLAPLRKERPPTVPQVIALIGRVTPIKDVKTFIKAMKILVEKIPYSEGWIVGPEDEDPLYAEECKMLVKALNLENRVKFLGFRKITEILPKVGLVTLTSISEGMPMVVLEAFAAGVPCVTTDVGSCRQLIYGGLNEEDVKLGKAGEITPVGMPREIAEVYYKLLTDEKLWRECQRTAIERVEKFYSFEKFINNYRNVYETFLGVKHGGDINRT